MRRMLPPKAVKLYRVRRMTPTRAQRRMNLMTASRRKQVRVSRMRKTKRMNLMIGSRRKQVRANRMRRQIQTMYLARTTTQVFLTMMRLSLRMTLMTTLRNQKYAC